MWTVESISGSCRWKRSGVSEMNGAFHPRIKIYIKIGHVFFNVYWYVYAKMCEILMEKLGRAYIEIFPFFE